jgi:excinuclease ABC subunit A
LQRLVENGDTVLVIEHNLDIIKAADYLVDLGPEGGDKGGQIVGVGTPEDLIKNDQSYTGKYLKSVIERDRERMKKLIKEKEEVVQ